MPEGRLVILATGNGGKTWSPANLRHQPRPLRRAFPDPNHGWNVGNSGTILEPG